MMSIRTHYENLQVAENASPEVIRGAYRSLSQKWHPDKNPNNIAEAERIASLINEAYAVLSDPQRRKEHDLWIKSERERDAERTTKGLGNFQPPPSKETSVMPTPSKLKGAASGAGISVAASVLFAIVLLLANGVGNIGGKVASEAIFGPSSDDIVAATAREMNKTLPMMVDGETRLDSTTAGPGRVLAYNYTLINYVASQLDASSLAAIERQVVGVSCGQQQQNLLSKNVAMRFRYTSSDGYMVRDFTINRNGCGNAAVAQSVVETATPAGIIASTPPAARRPRTVKPERERCVIKSVMTDEEIRRCRAKPQLSRHNAPRVGSEPGYGDSETTANPARHTSKRYGDFVSTAAYGTVEEIKEAIDNGAYINGSNGQSTALISATRYNRPEIVRLLLSAGADVEVADKNGRTAMVHAKVNANSEIIEMLRSYGATDPFAK